MYCYALVGACRKVGSHLGQNNFEFYIPWQIITQRIVLDWCGVYVGNVLHAERYIELHYSYTIFGGILWQFLEYLVCWEGEMVLRNKQN